MALSIATIANIFKAKPKASAAAKDSAFATVTPFGMTVGARPLVNPNWSAGYTPEIINEILIEAERGSEFALARYYKLADTVLERETHMAAVINGQVSAVAGLPHGAKPPDDSPLALEIANDVQAMLGPSKPLRLGALGVISSGLTHGVGVGSIRWDTSDPESWKIAELIQKPAHFLTYDRSDGRTVQLRSEQAGQPARPFQPGEAVVFTPKRNSALQVKNGLMWILCWGFLIKSIVRAMEMQFLETFGQPVITGLYPHGASEADIQMLKGAVQNINSGFRAVYRDDLNIKFEEVTKHNTNMYEQVSRYIDEQTSKLVLSSTLTVDSGKVGSQALGKVHTEGKYDVIRAIAHQWSACLQELVNVYVVWNYGPDAPIPTVDVNVEESEDLLQASEVVLNLTSAGVELSAAEIRQRFGFRDPVAGEAIVGGQPKPVTPPAIGSHSRSSVPANQRDAIDDLVDNAQSDWVPIAANLKKTLLTAANSATDIESLKKTLLATVLQNDPVALQALITKLRTTTHLAGAAGAEIGGK